MSLQPLPAPGGPVNPAGAGYEPILVALGDIGVSEHWVVTPAGTVPLRGAQFHFADVTRLEPRIPVWAIVLAILFFPIGLLFLLAKENRISGAFQFTVVNGAFAYQCFEPASMDVVTQNMEAQNRVNFARQRAYSASLS